MISLSHEIMIEIPELPVQWIPKIELYYPDLPQFPMMYIHFCYEDKRVVACPVSVSFEINGNKCNAVFLVLTNQIPDSQIKDIIYNEISNRIGFSDRITKETIFNCCKNDKHYIKFMQDLWQYIEQSYGSCIPFGRFYEEFYSIPRFVAAWQPKTGRQSEMRMLYNFMSAFGTEVKFPDNWKHLEYYVIPTYDDVRIANYSEFPKFKKLYDSVKKIFELEFTDEVTIGEKCFKVMPEAWEKKKDDFISAVSDKYYKMGIITEENKYYIEKLVDAFNRYSWRAAYFISAFLNIENTDYRKWTKQFFIDFYVSGNKLKGYSEKVVACFLQQGFGKSEIIPIDTWIKTFYSYPLGISSISEFYNRFDMLGKLERLIWLASQSNKTNMRDFFNILWCQRYGTIGNKTLRGINPIACSLCKLKKTCVGLEKMSDEKIFICNVETEKNLPSEMFKNVSFLCLLENNIPKKVYRKRKNEMVLTDEFSGYLMTSFDKLPDDMINKQIITFREFISIF